MPEYDFPPIPPQQEGQDVEFDLVGSAASTILLTTRVLGDSSKRFNLAADGTHSWGPGNGAVDVSFARSAAGVLTVTGSVAISAGTTGSLLFYGANGVISQNNSSLSWDNTNLALMLSASVPNLTVHPFNYWVDTFDPDVKKFALTLGDGGLWVSGSTRHDIVMNFGYNLGTQGPIDTGDVAWGIQFETFACRGAQFSQTTGDVEFFLIYAEPGGFSVRPIGVDVDRVTHVSDLLFVATNFSYTGSAAGGHTETSGYFSFGGFNPTSGAQPFFNIQGSVYTNITASTEKVFLNVDSQTNSWTWATGNFALQRFALFGATTINFNGASTITTAATVYIAGAPVAGTLCTLTNKYALATNNGDVIFDTGGTLVGMYWDSANHLLRIMNSASKYGTFQHDAVNFVVSSSSGQLNLNAAASATVQIGNNFTSFQFTNQNIICNSDNLALVGTAAKRMLSINAVTHNVWTAASDANASAALTAGTLSLGIGGATALDTILLRDAANVFAQKNSTTAQEFRIYGTTTGPKYLSLKHDGTNAYITQSGGNQIAFATAAKGTTDTTGYLCMPASAGPPTGVPANIPSGQIPYQIDSTNKKLYAYIGGAWVKAQVTAVDVIFG